MDKKRLRRKLKRELGLSSWNPFSKGPHIAISDENNDLAVMHEIREALKSYKSLNLKSKRTRTTVMMKHLGYLGT